MVFESARAGDTLYLHIAGIDGKVLVHAGLSATTTCQLHGGRLTLSVAKAWVEQVKAEGEDGPAAADESAARWAGDRNVLDEMLQLAEIQTLPWLSRALGVAGMTGATHAARIAMHKTACQSAKALDSDVAPLQVAARIPSARARGERVLRHGGNGCNCWSWVAATAANTAAVRSTTAGAATAVVLLIQHHRRHSPCSVLTAPCSHC